MGVRGVTRVSMHEPLTSVVALYVVQFKRNTPETEIWRALYGASSLLRYGGKYVIAVDEDIDPANMDKVVWAICTRCDPRDDVQILNGCWSTHLDPMAYGAHHNFNSRMVIDANCPARARTPVPPRPRARLARARTDHSAASSGSSRSPARTE